MARSVEITVKGLALCYIKNSDWVVDFACDPLHKLYFKYPGGDRRLPLRNDTRDLRLKFLKAKFVKSDSPPEFPQSRFVNLSADYAHDKDSVGDSNLKLERRHRYRTGTMRMVIPESTLTLSDEVTEDSCWVQEVGTQNKTELGPVARHVIISCMIESDDDNELRVIITDRYPGDVFDMTFPTTNEPGAIRFEFDNGCGDDCIENDSVHVYDVVKDRLDGGKQFVTGAVDDVTGDVPGSNPEDFLLKDMGKSPTHGNCDPVGSDPPPG